MYKKLRSKADRGNSNFDYFRNSDQLSENVAEAEIQNLAPSSKIIDCLKLYNDNFNFFLEYMSDKANVEKVWVSGKNTKDRLIDVAKREGTRIVRMRSGNHYIDIRIAISDEDRESYPDEFTWARFCACCAFFAFQRSVYVGDASLTANFDKSGLTSTMCTVMNVFSIPGCHFLYNMFLRSYEENTLARVFVAGMCVMLDYSNFIRSYEDLPENYTVFDWLKEYDQHQDDDKICTRSLLRQNKSAAEVFKDPQILKILKLKVLPRPLKSVKADREFMHSVLANIDIARAMEMRGANVNSKILDQNAGKTGLSNPPPQPQTPLMSGGAQRTGPPRMAQSTPVNPGVQTEGFKPNTAGLGFSSGGFNAGMGAGGSAQGYAPPNPNYAPPNPSYAYQGGAEQDYSHGDGLDSESDEVGSQSLMGNLQQAMAGE